MILIIDNYDSFTWNLYQALGSLADGEPVRVERNDALDAAELVGLDPRRVVLSPGPGHPDDARLSLRAGDLLPRTPVLGVCLGHQALARAAGAQVVRSPRPTHGRAVPVEHDGRPPFQGLPSPTPVALYHSLVVEQRHWPGSLAVAARNPQGDVMALRHRERPHVGVQFHPESFMTEQGIHLLRNFLHGP